ncbi:hypothetical protein PG984_000600 [Apiospora sp. TS-2023a]
MADTNTPPTGTAQGEAIAANASHNTPAPTAQQSLPEASTDSTGTKPSSDTQIKREGTQPQDETTQATLKEEPTSPMSHPQRLPSEKVEPMPLSTFQHVHRALAQEDTQKLEALSQLAKQELAKLVEPLSKVADASDSERSLRNVEELLQRSVTAQTIIGVIGETGAGKSSLINALLGEERLLPTNGMRACTAAVTEITWNDSDKSEELYRAEIEFITLEEWQKELEHLYSDLVVTGGVSKDASNKKTEAGIAMAKIRAVYPNIDDAMLLRKNAEKLANDNSLRDILGTTLRFKADNASKLYKLMKPYMDSNDRARGRKTTKVEDRTELWPLTKVVRVYTKADVLSTGVVLVDLPGCGDSNAARGTVAEKYMEKCSSIWIVAPISRAVDNKAAQHLLGESFKMQLKYDGNYTNITFICSQTDGIVVEEMADSLELGGTVVESKAATNNTEVILASKDADYKKSEASYASAMDERKNVDKQLTLWKDLESQAYQGKTVFAPVSTGMKRKANTEESQASKRPRRMTRSSVIFVDSDDEDDVAENPVNSGGDDLQPLTINQIQERIKALRDQRVALTEKMRNEKEQPKHNLRNATIRGRNEYSRSTIQQDFAHGLKILDQETAMQDQGENYNPEKDLRDYEAVANLLPVFCVSSREYQKKCGRIESQLQDDGFVTLEDTEIPQLLEHAKKSTNTSRAKNCKKFLNNAIQIWQSLQLWASDITTGEALTEERMNEESEKLDQGLDNLRKALKDAATNTTAECKNTMKKNLFNKFKTAVAKAAKEARPITEGWISAKRDDGRRLYPFMTYRAVIRRRGYYKNGEREIDFNEELTRPLKLKLASSWESTFTKEIPSVLEQFCHSIEQRLHYFHDLLTDRLKGTAAASRIEMLKPQLAAHIQSIKDLQETFRSDISLGQREASRDFTPEIKENMGVAYDNGAAETGTGCFKRMQQIIDDHVSQNDRTMYEQATKQVTKSLYRLCNNYQKDMVTTIDNTVDSMVSDYKNCIMKRDLSAASIAIRREVIRIISKVDDEFRRQMTPEPSEANDMNTEQKVSSNDISTQAPTAATAMDIDDSPNTAPVATEQPTAKVVADDSNTPNPSASVELPTIKNEPVSPQNGKTDNSQKPDNDSSPSGQLMGGTST